MDNDSYTSKRYAPYILYDELIRDKALRSNNHCIISISPHDIENWEYHDRPKSELGNIDILATEFKRIGQIVPCIVRAIASNKANNMKYELIVGERRWRAAKKAEVQLKVIVYDLDDRESALIQSSENLQRKDLSDYAKFLSYHSLIKNNILTQKDLVSELNFSKSTVSRMLSFKDIPLDVVKYFKDMSGISSRTSSAIVQICNKGKRYKDAIINLSSKIIKGKIGHEKLAILVENSISKNASNEINQIFVDSDLIFTVKNKNKITIELSSRFSLVINKKNQNERLIKKLKNLYYESLNKN